MAIRSTQGVLDYYEAQTQRGEEGLILKRADGRWEQGDRSGFWMKLKPSSTHAFEFDVVIVAAARGSSVKSGTEYKRFLVAVKASHSRPRNDRSALDANTNTNTD